MRALTPGQVVFVAYPDGIERGYVIERGDGGYNRKQRLVDPYVVRTPDDLLVAARAYLHTDALAAAAHSERLSRELVD